MGFYRDLLSFVAVLALWVIVGELFSMVSVLQGSAK